MAAPMSGSPVSASMTIPLRNAPSTTDNRLTGAVDGLVDAPSTKNDEKTVAVDGVISVLQATIDTLQGQLEVKDRQIEQQVQTITRLTDALAAAQQTAAAAQALHAGTIKQQLSDGSGTEQEGIAEGQGRHVSAVLGVRADDATKVSEDTETVMVIKIRHEDGTV